MPRSLAVLFSVAHVCACAPRVEFTSTAFCQPESVVHDVAADEYLVSNVNGRPFEHDDNGFISRMSIHGKVTGHKFVDGRTPDVELHAPKGMAVIGDVLYVADIDHIRKFHRMTGQPIGAVAVPGARSLNGVTVAADGSLFVTDTGWSEHHLYTGAEAIWRLATDGTLSRIAPGEDLGQPNGIVAARDGLHFVSWRDGSIIRFDAEGELLSSVRLPGNQLDGLVRAPDGGYYVSSWRTDRIYRVRPNGGVRTLFHRAGICGIGYDEKRDRLLIPLWRENAVLGLGL